VETMAGQIVFGIDGSMPSRQAMDWAFDEARRSGSELHLLHVVSDRTYSGRVDAIYRDVLIKDAQRVVADAEAMVPADLADRCRVEWLLGPPVEVLVRAGQDARLVVVGTHGRGAVGAAVLGSVGRHVLRHAHGPVVVAHPVNAPGSRVVVGIDLEVPEPALSAAFEQAAARGLPLTVIRSWTLPPVGGPGVLMPIESYDLEDIEKQESRALDDMVREAAAAHPNVAVEAMMLRGDARHVLVEASAGSELVVVGAHGRGWFSGLMLGSTSADVAARALAPVLVAR
jgi:nucleotide-binding universal stress UspA family protein